MVLFPLKKVLLGVAAVLVVGIGALAVFVLTYSPDSRPVTDLKVDTSAKAVERGAYLSEIYGCIHCHTERDWSYYSSKPAGPRGAGGMCVHKLDHSFPGVLCSSNLTPDEKTGLGRWTDDEILRAIREGISKDGRALFPMMPYEHFRHMSDQDAHAIVAYLRTLDPVETAWPATDIDFPVSFFIKMAPEPITKPVAEPDRSNPVALGKYLTEVGGCKGCHSPIDDKHQLIAGQEYTGGQAFKAKGDLGNVHVVSANLTPDDTGLKGWTKDQFIALFRAHKEPAKIASAATQTLMPWADLVVYKDEDLAAIYDFLMTLAPVKKSIVKFPE